MRTRENLTGQTFGRLAVLGPAEDHVSPSGRRYVRWLCRCECGNQVTVMGKNLKSGVTRSCGCLQKDAQKGRREDLTGRTFGRLTVLGPAEDYVSPGGSHISRWLCRCECGNQVTVLGGSLKSGSTRSCGCLRKEANTRAHPQTPRRLTLPMAKARGICIKYAIITERRKPIVHSHDNPHQRTFP